MLNIFRRAHQRLWNHPKENPAVQFTKDAKAGLYDNYTDEVYNSMLKDIEDVAKFWHGKKRNVLFAGPTGCGKTEIWRVLSQLYPNIKLSMVQCLQWKAGAVRFKLRDILQICHGTGGKCHYRHRRVR